MNISIVIPAYNEEKYIADCLQSVIANRTDDIREIIVIDNASTDGTAAVAQQFPGVRVVHEPHKGLTHARQRGLIEAKGDLIAYLDADTRMPPTWAATVKKEFAKHPKMVSLSGPFHYYDLPPAKKIIAQGLWTLTAMPTFWMVGFMVLGANFVAKREALVQIGGFDTTISFYGEDTDIARRLSKAGKAKFSMEFFIIGSGRRLLEEGIVLTFSRYAMNYFATAIRHKPLTKQHKDIR
jgi:glycosyltransferase involved in cell wall biosynthesis